MSLKGFEILTSVLCEEVRQESSGRSIILGAMVNGFNLSDEEDKRIKRLALYLEMQMPGERIDLQVRLVKSDEEDPILYADVETAEMYDNMPNPDSWIKNPIAVVVMGREDFDMKGSGDYHLQYATKKGEWENYRTFYFPPESTSDE